LLALGWNSVKDPVVSLSKKVNPCCSVLIDFGLMNAKTTKGEATPLKQIRETNT